MRKIIATIAATVLLAACQLKIDRPFLAAEHERCAGRGHGQIQGQAFALTRGGDVKFAAGRSIFLVPATDYTREMAEKMTTGLAVIATPDLNRFTRETIGDGSGNFVFSDLTACDYILITTVTWQVPPYGTTTGGTMWTAVSVTDGQTAKVILRR